MPSVLTRQVGYKVGASIAAVAASLLLVSEVTSADPAPRRSAADLMDVLMWNREPVGGPFALVDHSGRTRTDADFRGKLLLIYFGFTYCPDVCPTDLQSMATAVDQLGPAGEAVQPLFVTLDPERDTPEHLAEYVPSFHPRLIGLTGSDIAIRQAADAYKVFYAKVPGSHPPDYNVDHSSFIYLADTNGRYLGFFPPGTTADRLVQVIQRHLPN
jgi:protein SCO1/2